ncbi:MAG: flagellar type III secretion system pore protein FliP [Candidatus Rokubacteria bacterium]|nr:flagellar type III secretion system pore protein FliP [Candidatus Rokubacteria bacterium]
MRHSPTLGLIGATLAALLLLSGTAQALPLPRISFTEADLTDPSEVSTMLQLVALLTVLALAPSILVLLTSFTRVLIVLSFLRHALGTAQMPPNQIIIGLSLFLTAFIMAPVGQEIHRNALAPYLARQIGPERALERGLAPVRAFMLRQTRERDLALMVDLSRSPRPNRPGDVQTHVLIPAFVISELRTAFQLSFVIFIPFLVIDMVVGSVLMSMGMLMLPPILVSLPIKILLFVMADGWHLVIRSLVTSYR